MTRFPLQIGPRLVYSKNVCSLLGCLGNLCIADAMTRWVFEFHVKDSIRTLFCASPDRMLAVPLELEVDLISANRPRTPEYCEV